MGMVDAVKLFLHRYTDFQGRSSRSEFWWVYLAYFLVYIAAMVLMMILMMVAKPLGYLIVAVLCLGSLAVIIPSLAIAFRRLHDSDKSAWWLLISLIPFGSIVILVFYCLPGTVGPNKFGPDPLTAATPAEAFT